MSFLHIRTQAPGVAGIVATDTLLTPLSGEFPVSQFYIAIKRKKSTAFLPSEIKSKSKKIKFNVVRYLNMKTSRNANDIETVP